MNNKAKVTNFWVGKKVFITGNTGFKGSWLSLWLNHLGAKIKGYSINLPTSPSMFSICKLENIYKTEFADIINFEKLKYEISNFKPDIVIHMAAQSIVRKSYSAPIETFSTNVMGTVNLLEACRSCSSIKVILNVTSDKCYRNNEWHWSYRENDQLGGKDAYSSSKACAELVGNSFRDTFFKESPDINLLSVRAGNVIGGGDWAEDRLIPDVLRAIGGSKTLQIRNPNAIRPWQHVLDLISGYLTLIQSAYEQKEGYEGAWNFGPNEENIASVEKIVNILIEKMPSSSVRLEQKASVLHEAQLLKLDSSKARSQLGWNPLLSLDESVELIVNWQRSYLFGRNMYEETLIQIKDYIKATHV